jgi:type VI secretion system protein ImpK
LRYFQIYTSVLLEIKSELMEPAASGGVEGSAAGFNKTTLKGYAAPDVPIAVRPRAQVGALALAAEPEIAPIPGRPQAIWNRLALLLDQQLMEASRTAGPLGLEFHREAVYVMAALTDEVLLHLDWEGVNFWLGHLLEARFFQTHLAGEQLFERIDQLLLRDDEPSAEMAAVYLAALALGFRGRYRGVAHQNTIDSYRKRLFFFIARRQPELTAPGRKLFPEAYQNTLQAGALPRIPSPRRWIFAFGGAVFAWFVIARLLWFSVSFELRHQLCSLTPGCSSSLISAPFGSR